MSIADQILFYSTLPTLYCMNDFTILTILNKSSTVFYTKSPFYNSTSLLILFASLIFHTSKKQPILVLYKKGCPTLGKILFHHKLSFRGTSTSCSVYQCSLRYLLTNSLQPSLLTTHIFMRKMRICVPKFWANYIYPRGWCYINADQIVPILKAYLQQV